MDVVGNKYKHYVEREREKGQKSSLNSKRQHIVCTLYIVQCVYEFAQSFCCRCFFLRQLKQKEQSLCCGILMKIETLMNRTTRAAFVNKRAKQRYQVYINM